MLKVSATPWRSRPKYSLARPAPRGHSPVVDRQVGVGDYQFGVDLVAGPKAVAAGARAIGRVEREIARRQLVIGGAAHGACQVLGKSERLGLTAPVLAFPVARSPTLLGADPRGTICTSATPSASFRAVSNESVRRRSMPARRTSRSTTTSMVCAS